MRKYYLFVIKDKIIKTYNNDLKGLYINLYQIYKNKKNNINYLISLFEQLCLPFQVDILANYLNHLPHLQQNGKKYLYKKNGEVSLMELSYPTIVIMSNRNLPYFFRMLNLYNKKILVCDFDNHDYFWLSMQKSQEIEYN
ncbi:MAG: sporulation inhibitor of replication protein SirA [Mollicutes bacterium]|nr:sporulation inhibitor of replication protein SirA [Mollicutes bacterium]